MLSSLTKLLDVQFFVEQAKQSQSSASLALEAGKENLSWADIAFNLSIVASLLSQTFAFVFKALGWLGGWGFILVLLSFIFLSFLNFLSPFKRANYLLVLFFISVYAYYSQVPIKAVMKYVLLMIAPAFLSGVLYLFFSLPKILKKTKKTLPQAKEIRRPHVSLAVLRRERRAYK